MTDFVTPYLFNAHALPVDTDEPHARHGNHLRVNHHPLLGLPVEWVYAALIGDYALKALMLTRRFRSGRWRTLGPGAMTPSV
jgi:Na+-driven multidrug efflux pump